MLAVAAICLYPVISIMHCRYTQSDPHNNALSNLLSVLLIAVTSYLLDAQDTIVPFNSTAHPLTLC